MTERFHILHLEDNDADAVMVKAVLARDNISCTVNLVSTRLEFHAGLAHEGLDLIFSDFSMPNFDGLSALDMAKKERPDVPFIFVSGTIGEELAIEVLTQGAVDYVLKDRMTRLPAAVRRAIAEVRGQRDRRLAEEQLRNQAALLDLAQDAICLNDIKRGILYWNKGAERLYGWKAEEVQGRDVNQLLFQNDLTAPKAAFKSLLHAGVWLGELEQFTRFEKKIVVESRWALRRDENGEPASILIINTDITEKKQMEAQFLRTQRVETIGALAGGIAHDLNNSLTPISIGVSLLRTEKISPEGIKVLDMMRTSIGHSVDMVKQILTFSRGVGGTQTRLRITDLIFEIVQFVRDTFPKTIAIESRVESNVLRVKGNATQLHQVLLNLCVNARDAMPNGGLLRLQATNIVLDETNRQTQVAAGPYVLVTVQDNGHGMSGEILAKIFEPFFTTKEIGKGTGLGLSTVIGIVKTHGGFVEVTSEVGSGSLFRVFLPACCDDESQRRNAGPELI